MAGVDWGAGCVPEVDRGACLDAGSSLSISFTRGDGALAAACGSAASAAASRAGDSGIGLGALELVTGASGGVVSILLRDTVEPSRSCLPETDPAMDAVSES